MEPHRQTNDDELDAILGEWGDTLTIEVLESEGDSSEEMDSGPHASTPPQTPNNTPKTQGAIDIVPSSELSLEPLHVALPAVQPQADSSRVTHAPQRLTPERDRLMGMIIGAALGSAIALPCHNRSPWVLRDNKEADPSKFEYPSGVMRRGYSADDWSGTIDHLVILLRASREHYENTPVGRRAFTRAFAQKLHGWSNQGFPKLGDGLGVSFDSVTETAIKDPNFTARERAPPTQNNALGAPIVRAIALARLGEDAAHLTAWSTAQTHNNQLVISGACAVVGLLRSMLADPVLRPEHLTNTFKDIASGGAKGRELYASLPSKGTLREIDYETGPANAAKTVQTAAWAYRQLLKTPPAQRDEKMFHVLVTAVAQQGRNASVNTAVAGAVLGAAVGYSGLPKKWREGMPHRDWLIHEIDESMPA